MPRQARLDAPEAVHPIIGRGLERRPIFRDAADHEAFRGRLARLLSDTATACYAWALLPNHFHLLLRSGQAPLATVMRRLLTGDAGGFNRKYRRPGHLLQNRDKSLLGQEEPYLRELVRSIHLNPFRSRQGTSGAELARYPYCGHGVLWGTAQAAWQDTDSVLGVFAPTRRRARQAYARFVQEGQAQGRRPELTGGGLRRSLQGWIESGHGRTRQDVRVMADERILGDGESVAQTLKAAAEPMSRRAALRRRGGSIFAGL